MTFIKATPDRKLSSLTSQPLLCALVFCFLFAQATNSQQTEPKLIKRSFNSIKCDRRLNSHFHGHELETLREERKGKNDTYCFNIHTFNMLNLKDNV